MTNFLITRCTVYDMAGVAMIQGAMVGLRTHEPEAQFAALVFPENDAPQPVCHTFLDRKDVDEAFQWADCALDIGGLCKGFDPTRLRYIEYCRKKDIPYIYMSQSFDNPAAEQLEGCPIVARGKYAATEVWGITGRDVPIAADLSFILGPTPMETSTFIRGYTTHEGKPIEEMYKACNELHSIQIILKPFKDKHFEPLLGIPVFRGFPSQIFGLIDTLQEIHTARYHVGVGAIMCKKPLKLYVSDQPKYDDLLSFKDMTREELKQSAMVSCEIVWKTLRGK